MGSLASGAFNSSCGIHAFKLDAVDKAKNDFRAHFCADVERITSDLLWVVGTVSLWGRIAEHARGYRAQFAYPRMLIGASTGVDGPALAAAYGITFEEDASWKSVFQFVESSASPSPFQFPLHTHHLQPVQQVTLSQPWPRLQLSPSTVPPSSRSSFQPNYIQAAEEKAIMATSPAVTAKIVNITDEEK
jgi:hypothetical protein